jgi:DNA-binding transcriptional LysR family regulator
MDKFGDIDLFVRVVKNKGLAVTAREMSLSPASVTIKINRLEEYYGVKLLNRTTRQVSLTEEGKQFYERCLRILSEVDEAEEQLRTGRDSFSGPLSITAPVDIGQQHIAPLLAKFAEQHPGITATLHLNDGVVNLLDSGFDLGVRFGVLKDNRMIARKLASNKRVVCASPRYLKKHGMPKTPEDLLNHRCLTMIRKGEPLTEWHFSIKGKRQGVAVNSFLSSNNGAQIKNWAVAGHGIALKSIWDIQDQLKTKKLNLILEDYAQDFEAAGIDNDANLNVVYLSREYLPERVRAFIEVLLNHFK